MSDTAPRRGRRSIADAVNVIPGDYAISVGVADMPAPRGWRWVKLTDVARLESGHTPSRRHEEYWGGDIPWIGIPDARENHGRRIRATAQCVTQAGIDNSAARVLPASTVCLSRTASVGYVTVMDRPMATSQDFVNWVCGAEIDPDFLMHLLLAEKDALLRFGKGSTHTTIYFPEVQAFHVCLPVRPEQRRIVAKLDGLRARSRRAKEALDAVPALLDRLRQSILAAAFRGDLTADWREQNPDVEPASELLKRIRIERRKRWEEAQLAKLIAKGKPPKDDRWKAKYVEPEPVDDSDLPELPDGWCWTTLGELAWGAGYGTSAKCDYEFLGPAVLRIPNVARGKLDLTDVKHASDTTVIASTEFVAPGDLLIVRTNGSRDLVGRGAMVAAPMSTPTSFASYLIRFRLVADAAPWVGAMWNSPAVRMFVHDHAASSAGQHNISLTTLWATPIALPPLHEAVELIRTCTNALQSTEGTLNAAAELATKLNHLDAAVLAAAFRGELVEREASSPSVSASP